MKQVDVIKTALGNTMRSKLRTFLTVIAIVIGAFTLTITSGLGAGISQYVSKIVEGFGEDNQIYVMPVQDMSQAMGTATSGPTEYEPESASASGEWGMQALTQEDIDAIAAIDHVESVDPIVFVNAEYIEVPDGGQYTVNQLGFPSDIAGVEFLAGGVPDRDADEIVIPETWLETFGIDNSEDAEQVLGEKVDIGVTNRVGETQTVTAEVVGISQQMLSGAGSNPTPSQKLNEALYDAENSGLEVEEIPAYIQAVAVVDNLEANEAQIKADLAEIDMTGMTVEDQLGIIQGIINTVTWVLNGFALIALLAASFGIVNTLLMSVQERTREIGLMKALGMSNGKVFGLFSTEAVMIGVMGSIIGVLAGVGIGMGGNALLVNGPLSDVAGLSLFAIEPLSILLIVLLILFIAFLAGTLPASRAAKKDPIDALRYE